ncbi:hypothetical protein [Halalkalibacter hemicellulosilyticus]|uniref:Uncharacterized protein n=1 Tax=Halalkalibacter hemicellulosilyticusJCM 9152 TaxID=1236971 RepID=W4QA99_9BACI|nr:hypothetical protein [Halalkalibacter hemicellulosilyticus]GAE28966.1 hypothetical protein JCM9152_305 [Halalkalibacter hemicellulosilyticusJCM 9152]
MRREMIQFLEYTTNEKEMKNCIYHLDSQGLHSLVEHLCFTTIETQERWLNMLQSILNME